MKHMKKFFELFLLLITVAIIFGIKFKGYVSAATSLPENISINFSDGDIPIGDIEIFGDITISNVKVSEANSIITPGETFDNLVGTSLNTYYNNSERKLDSETFYFGDGDSKWAYTFTGWQVVGSEERLPEKTVFQPGDLIFENTLIDYLDSNNVLHLEAVWGKCHFIKNPYPVLKYKNIATFNSEGLKGWVVDEETSKSLSDNAEPVSSDLNDGRTPDSAKATIDGLYEYFRDQVYVKKTQSKSDSYATVVMLCGELNYIKDTNGYVNNNGNEEKVSINFGQKITKYSQASISATFKSLTSEVAAYNFIYKPRGYSNQYYGNFRFDNINFIQLKSSEIGGQTVGTEFQLNNDNSFKNYFETTSRYNSYIPNGRKSAISTFRPNNTELVVLNGGYFGSFQTTWSSNINRPNVIYEWFVGRKTEISGAINCGTTAAYADTTATVNVNFELTVTGGSIHKIYGGSKGVLAKSIGSRKIKIIGNGEESFGEYNPKVDNIYGGAQQSKFYGDIEISVFNATNITNIYGGGDEYTATTYGNININVINSTIKGDIFGGGYNANSEKDENGYGGDVFLNIDNSKVYGNIFGSGMGRTQTITIVENYYTYGESSNWYKNDESMYIEGWEYPLGYDKDGNIDTSSKYYYPKYDLDTGYVNIGGKKTIVWTDNSPTGITLKHEQNMAYLSLATVENVEMNINNSQIGTNNNGKGNVYGGGSIARVLGDTKINITGQNTIIYGSVYGGGDGVSIPEGINLYKPLDPTTYKAPTYTIESKNSNGVPTKVSTTEQSPSYVSSTYGKFTWSNDESLLESDTPGIDFEKKIMYSPNTVGLGKVLGNTAVNITDGIIYGDVYGGGNKGSVDGNTKVVLSGNIIVGNVYGGCNQSDVFGTVTLEINNGNVGNAFGGNNQSGSISNEILVNINGGNITNVYGGGNKANATIDTTINIRNAIITNVYGGGKEASINNIELNTASDVDITNLYGGGDQGITNGNIVLNISGRFANVFGGANKANIIGSVDMNINNANIESCFGGNNLSGDLFNNLNVNVTNANITSFYGGGNKANTSVNTIVNIIDSEIITLYGGGKEAYINDIEVHIDGGIFDNIYGGGYSGDVMGEAIITIVNNPYISGNVFGGGEKGDILLTNHVVIFDAIIDGNVYGGGLSGDVGSTAVTIKGATINGNLYGGGFEGNVFNHATIIINDANIAKNVYGGGFAGTVDNNQVNIDDTTLSDATIYVGGNVFGGGEGKTASVYNSTSTIINLNLETNVTEQLLTTDTLSGKSETKVEFVGTYSKIIGNVYGGGDLAQVGKGVINTSNNTATISNVGSTHVVVICGYIAGSVFGGGSGIPKEGEKYDIYMGTIFGTTKTQILGGYIGGNVYGGGTQSRLYKESSSTSYVATVDIEEYDKNIIINGSVFGGGDRGNSATTNASVATTIGDVVININNNSNASSKIYFVNGGIYGDGNLCLVNGQRTINMNHFTTGNEYLKTFYSLQRADMVNLYDSDIVLLGAIDLVEEGDSTIYSINRIGQINMNAGSTIKLDQIVKYLENITSDEDTDRKFISNGYNGNNAESGPEIEPLTISEINDYINNNNQKNIICVSNGLYLEIMQENNEYGTVDGLFTLQLLRANLGEGGGFVYASIEKSTGDFICMTKFNEDGEYMNVIDDKGGFINEEFTYYCWFIQGALINYSVNINGYIGSEEEKFIETGNLPTHDMGLYYILNYVKVDSTSALFNAIETGSYDLVSKNTGLVNQEIALEFVIGNNSWFLDYVDGNWTFGNLSGANDNSDEIRSNILATNVNIDDKNSLVYVILHKSIDVNAEVTNMQFEVELLKYMDDPNKTDNIVTFDGTSKLHFNVSFSIVRLVPVQNSYYGPYENFAGLGTSQNISITTGSAFTFEYQTRYIPSAFPSGTGQMVWALSTITYSYYIDSLGNYMTLDEAGNVITISNTLTLDPNETSKILVNKAANGTYSYEHNGKIVTFEQQTVAQSYIIPEGTKIIMIDLTIANKPNYYYFICYEDTSYINLQDFMVMGTTTKLKDSDTPEYMKQFLSGVSSRVTERLVFTFDLENVEFEGNDNFKSTISLKHNYVKDESYVDIMDYVKSETNFDNTTYTRSYPKTIDFEINVNQSEKGIEIFTINFEQDEYYEDENAKIILNLVSDDYWTNTNLIEGKVGIKIESIISGGKLPDGIEFVCYGNSYFAKHKNEYVIIPIDSFGEVEIYVKNILGTIKTTTKAEFIASLVILPDTQYTNNSNSSIETISSLNISCSINYRDQGYLKVDVENNILSINDNLVLNVYLKGQINTVSTKIYYKAKDGYRLLNVTIPSIEASEIGIKYEIPISLLKLSDGAYKIVFANGFNEEVIKIIIK